MNDHELDFLIADAMTKVDAFLARGAHYGNVAIVVTPSIYYQLARRAGYQWCENIRIDGDGYYGRYQGFDIYIVENAPEENMCFPAFHYETNETLIPVHPGEYLIFGNNEELYRTDDGVTIRECGMKVAREVTRRAVDDAAAEARSAFAAQIDARLYETTNNYWAHSAEWKPVYMNSWMYDVVRAPFKKRAAKTQKPSAEQELQPTPELDEFIEQFRRK